MKTIVYSWQKPLMLTLLLILTTLQIIKAESSATKLSQNTVSLRKGLDNPELLSQSKKVSKINQNKFKHMSFDTGRSLSDIKKITSSKLKVTGNIDKSASPKGVVLDSTFNKASLYEHKMEIKLNDAIESQEIADDGKTYQWNGQDDNEDLKSEYNELEIPEEQSEEEEEEEEEVEEVQKEPEVEKNPDEDSRSYFDDVDMEVPTEELANEGENLLEEIRIKEEEKNEEKEEEEDKPSDLVSVVDSFSELMPNMIPSLEFRGSIINDIISDLVYDIVENRVEENPKTKEERQKEEEEKMKENQLAEQEFESEVKDAESLDKESEENKINAEKSILRILQLVKDSNSMRDKNINVNMYKNAHLLEMPMFMNCMLNKTCSFERKLSSFYTRLYNQNKSFIHLMKKRERKGMKSEKAISFREYQDSHKLRLLKNRSDIRFKPKNKEKELYLQRRSNKDKKLDGINKLVTLITDYFRSNKEDEERKLTEKAETSTTSEPEPEKEESLWSRFKNWWGNLFKSDEEKRRLLEGEEEEIKDDPIEIIIGKFENDYKQLLSKLKAGFTNEDLRLVTNEYIKTLKTNLIKDMRVADKVIDVSTKKLDALRDHLNSNEITVENMGNYLEDVRKIWKDKAEDSINPETSAKLNALSDSATDFENRISKKIPQKNALAKQFKKFMSKYKFKLKEYGKFLETGENRDKMKEQLNDSIDELIDQTKNKNVDKTNVASLLNDLKNDVNSKLFKSLNEKNLRFILHNAVGASIQDLESVENPEKSSNFLFTKPELGDFTRRIINIMKELNKDKQKLGVQLHTGILQKILASGEDLMDKMESEEKKVDLVKLSKAVFNNIKAANLALEDDEVKDELKNLITDYIDYNKIRNEFDLSGLKRTKTYEFLTKDIHVTKSDLPTRLLYSLNKNQLKQAYHLNSEARTVLRFVRKLILLWKKNENNPRKLKESVETIYRILSGNSYENFKL
jgi:hypothetical protein